MNLFITFITLLSISSSYSQQSASTNGKYLIIESQIPLDFDVNDDSQVGIKSDHPLVILDTGLNYLHPYLKRSLWINPKEIDSDGIDNDHNGYVDDISGYNFSGYSRYPFESYSSTMAPTLLPSIKYTTHGTMVAGVINSFSSNIPLAPVKVCITGGCPHADILSGMRYAVSVDAPVVNLSIDIYELNEEDSKNQFLHDFHEITDNNPNTLFVVAAGNYSIKVNDKNFSKNFKRENILIVGSLNDKQNDIATHSNYGLGYVDLYVKGVNINTYKFNGISDETFKAKVRGTSFATPFVAAYAYSISEYSDFQMTASELKQYVLKTAKRKKVITGITEDSSNISYDNIKYLEYSPEEHCINK